MHGDSRGLATNFLAGADAALEVKGGPIPIRAELELDTILGLARLHARGYEEAGCPCKGAEKSLSTHLEFGESEAGVINRRDEDVALDRAVNPSEVDRATEHSPGATHGFFERCSATNDEDRLDADIVRWV